jgi:hypothetical protein
MDPSAFFLIVMSLGAVGLAQLYLITRRDPPRPPRDSARPGVEFELVDMHNNQNMHAPEDQEEPGTPESPASSASGWEVVGM